jgi:hypothetical protein
MADRAFGNEIRRVVDEQVPAAPWLEDRVMAAVSKDAAGRSARAFDGRGARLVMAALAAAIIAVLAVAVLVGTRHAQHPTSAPASKPSPSRDAAVLRYQALINGDMRPILSNYGLGCVSRQQCIAIATITRNASEALLNDLESTPAPTSLVPAAAQLKTALQQYIAALDAYIAALQDPNTNYLARKDPSATNLDLAVATVACWPGVPDLALGDQNNGYSCTVQPPSK